MKNLFKLTEIVLLEIAEQIARFDISTIQLANCSGSVINSNCSSCSDSCSGQCMENCSGGCSDACSGVCEYGSK